MDYLSPKIAILSLFAEIPDKIAIFAASYLQILWNGSRRVLEDMSQMVITEVRPTLIMKKILLIACSLFLCLASQPVQAQKPHSDLHNEIGVGAGPFSFFGGFIIGTADFFGALGNSLSHRAYSSNYYGLYDVHYYYQINHWCQVGVKFTVEGSRTTIYTDTLRTAVSSINRDLIFTLMPSVRFTYFNRPWVRLYAGADLGVGYLFSHTQDYAKDDPERKGSNFFPAFNVTVFGVNVGKRFYGLFELNAGFDSFVKFGIGARW